MRQKIGKIRRFGGERPDVWCVHVCMHSYFQGIFKYQISIHMENSVVAAVIAALKRERNL